MVEQVVLPDELDAGLLDASEFRHARRVRGGGAALALGKGERQEGLLDGPLRLLLHFLPELSSRLVHLVHSL